MPTDTATNTATPSDTSTSTFTPTYTDTPTPTDTPTDTATDTWTPLPTIFAPTALPFTPLPTSCSIPFGWQTYTVQPGDTLFSISLRAQVSMESIEAANCVTDPQTLIAGQSLYVPPGIFPTITPTGNPQDAIPYTCTNPSARITSPPSGAFLSGPFTIQGTAAIPNFNFYKLEIRAETASDFITFYLSHTAVTSDGFLGTLDTHAFAPGLYRIQLVVIDNTANYPIPPCIIRVRFG